MCVLKGKRENMKTTKERKSTKKNSKKRSEKHVL